MLLGPRCQGGAPVRRTGTLQEVPTGSGARQGRRHGRLDGRARRGTGTRARRGTDSARRTRQGTDSARWARQAGSEERAVGEKSAHRREPSCRVESRNRGGKPGYLCSPPTLTTGRNMTSSDNTRPITAMTTDAPRDRQDRQDRQYCGHLHTIQQNRSPNSTRNANMRPPCENSAAH